MKASPQIHKFIVFVLFAGAAALLASCAAQTSPEFTVSFQDGEKVFAPDRPLVFTFSQPVNIFSVRQPLNIEPKIGGTYDWDESRTILTYRPDAVIDPGRYTITVNPLLRSSAGFVIGQAGVFSNLSTSERYTARDDRPDEPVRASNPRILLVFAEPMDLESVTAGLSVDQPYELEFLWIANRLNIDLVGEFQPEQEFTITMQGAKTKSGQELLTYSWTHKFEPLKLTFAGGHNTLTLNFNFPMDREKTEAAISITEGFEYEIAWASDQQAKLELAGSIQPEANLIVSVSTEAAAANGGFLGLNAANLPESAEYELTTVPLVNFARPQESPHPGFVWVFNYPIDRQSFERSLQIAPEAEFDLIWLENNRRVTLELLDMPYWSKTDLFFNSPLSDVYGSELGGLAHQVVVTDEPISLDYSFDFGSPVVIRFKRDVDRQSVERILRPQFDLPVTFTWPNDHVLRIEGDFEELSRIPMELSSEVLDADGNPLVAAPYPFSINIWARPRQYMFGVYGADVETVDPNGNRLVQISDGFYGADKQDWEGPITFELFAITLEQYWDFLATDDFQSYSRIRKPWSDPGLTVIRTWQSTEAELLENLPYTPGAAQIPPGVPEGLYLLNMSTDHINDQLVINLTRTALLVKDSWADETHGQVFVLATNNNGSPLAGMQLSVYNEDGDIVASGLTGSDGIFTEDFNSDSSLSVAIGSGERWAMSGVGGDWGSRYSYRFSDFVTDFFKTPVSYSYLGYVYTDRPIYQPGQTVYFKAVLRQDDDATYWLPPAGTEVTLQVLDAKGNTIHEEQGSLGEFGTVDASYTLTGSAMLGEYQVRLLIDDEIHNQVFKVQTYEKPDISVDVTTDFEKYVSGQNIHVKVDTQYLFGEPVANTNVTLNFYYLVPVYESFWDYSLESNPGEYTWIDAQMNSVIVRTDSLGIAEIDVPAPAGLSEINYYYYHDSNEPDQLGIEATVDDGSDQYISGFTTAGIYPADLMLTIDRGISVKDANTPFLVNISADSISDFSSAGQMVSLLVENEQTRFSSYYSYSYSTVDVFEEELDRDDDASFELTLTSGFYRLTAETVDRYGNQIEQMSYLWIEDDFPNWWLEYDEVISMTLVDEQTYQPGDTARIEIFTTISGPALLTIERGSVLDYMPVQFTAPLTFVDIPIGEGYAPNIYIALHTWEPKDIFSVYNEDYEDSWFYEVIPDLELERARLNILVEDVEHQLNVNIVADQEIYAPRNEATFTITVTDHNGDPVDTELSAALVDEAIFQLSEDLSLDIHDAFYQPREDSVNTSDSYAPWRLLYDSSGEGGGDGAGPPAGDPRSDFPDTALWLPKVRTGPDGVVELEVTLPDTLTTWRLSVKAVSLQTEIGQGQTTFTTTQPLIVRPLLPEILNSGDQFVLSALVHNYSDQPIEAEVFARTTNLELQTSTSQQITIPAGKSRVVNWHAIAGEGEALVILTASEGQIQDSIESTIDIEPFEIIDSQVSNGILEDEASFVYRLPSEALVPPNVELRISRSVSASLLDGSDYLTGYPYGCIEQTMSFALPNAVLARAFVQLGQPERLSSAELQPKIEASIQRLYAMQHRDGGWGWWFDDDSHPYQTAWVVFGLTVIQEAGYDIDADVVAEGIAYLRETFAEMNPNTRAYALYVMAVAGQGDLEQTESALQAWNALDDFARTSLAASFYLMGQTEQAQDLISQVESTLTLDAQGGLFLISHRAYDYKFLSSGLRSTAFFLQNLIIINPDSPSIPKLAQWLIANKDGKGWRTTNETAYTILALSDYMLFERTAGSDQTVRVMLNNRLIETLTLKAGDSDIMITLDPSQLKSGENKIDLVNTDGDQSLFYSMSGETRLGGNASEPTGIEISREYLDPESYAPLTEFFEGQLVLVRLTVMAPSEASYVMIEDPLPAGFAALNEGLNTTGHDAVAEAMNAYNDRYYSWYRQSEQLGYNNKEIHPDRVVFFITDVKLGRIVIEYYVRATTAGEFQVGPSLVEAMYDPAWIGRGVSLTILIH